MQIAALLVALIISLPQLSQVQAVKSEDFTPPGLANKEVTANQNGNRNVLIEGSESETIRVETITGQKSQNQNNDRSADLSDEPTTLMLLNEESEDDSNLNESNSLGQANRLAAKERIQLRKELLTQEQASRSASRSASSSANRSVTAQEHMSIVAQHVQRLLAVPDRDGGIGAEIREIARQQKTTQASIAGELRQVQNQNRWLRWLIGPSKSNLDKLIDQQEQIEQRIVRLQELQLTTVDEAIQQTLEEAMVALEEQQLLLNQEIEAETSRFSLLSWAKGLIQQ